VTLEQKPGMYKMERNGTVRQDRAAIPAERLNLKAGDWVEVRSRDEILATLDEHGRFENLPFMPEMLRHCGQRFRVGKRADKTCDNIEVWSIRRMKDSVHLQGIRCDGAEHGGCEAGCLIFWKEAWLKRVANDTLIPDSLGWATPVSAKRQGLCTVESILAASCRVNSDSERVYSCQATEVIKFTSPMSSWDLRQYVRDLRSGNLASGITAGTRPERILEVVFGVIAVFRSLILSATNGLGYRFPYIKGDLLKTPMQRLDLQPGELVQVRSKEEIIATLDDDQKNRGLLFDSEMVPYCGGIYRVLRRVHHIIDEKTGKMMNMKYPCIILEGVACKSDFHRFCPRAIYHYWRESWLRRAPDVSVVPAAEQMAEMCERH
jgi:hypothetical protein